MPRQKVTTFLWFDDQAEEAARFYVSLFDNSSIGKIVPGPHGRAMVVEFNLAGVEYIALNGGPMFKFTEAISLSVDCETQEEINRLWTKLTEGGTESQCGWLKDKYGLSWQIVPRKLPNLLFDPKRGGNVMQTMLQMRKLDIQKLEDAYNAP